MMSLKSFSDTPIKMSAYNVYVSQYKNGCYMPFVFKLQDKVRVRDVSN